MSYTYWCHWWQSVAIPRGRGKGPCFPKLNHRGPTYRYFAPPPQTEARPLNPFGPLAEDDFLLGFRAPRDGSGPCGKHRTLQNEPGPRRMDQSRLARRINQGPAGQIRANGTDQGPAIRIRAPRDKAGPTRRMRALQDEVGPAGRTSLASRRWPPD